MKLHGYTIVIEPDENNTFHGYAPALRGCHTWGKSFEETLVRLAEAIELYLEDLVASGDLLPADTLNLNLHAA